MLLENNKVFVFTNSSKFLGSGGFFLFDKPILKVEYDKKILKINNKHIKTTRPLKFLEDLIKKKNLYAVGFISYDFKEFTLKEKFPKKAELPIPKIYFLLFKDFKILNDFSYPNFTNKIKNIKLPEKNSFTDAVKKALKYIENGDIYQINLSDRVEVEGVFNKERIFYNLIKIQPTNFMFLFKDKKFSVISASMELFLEKVGNTLTTKPIKGTRPRGKSLEEDLKLYNELKNSEKEKAENLMITDLMRNDLGKISKKGTIKVKELFKIEKYSTLFQMHSTISSTINDKTSLEEIINNTFPPGSVTGAPKKRAVQIIDKLEKYRRYVYCGAHFIIKPNLDFVSSVAIRQSIFVKDKCFIYVGAGIVADSNPEKEYEEILLKAKANLKALSK